MTVRGKNSFTIGPWPGGINLRDQGEADPFVNKRQLRWCKNLDVLDSGVLRSRLGCRKVLSTAPIYGGTGIDLIGSVIDGVDLYAILGKLAAGPTTTFYFTKNPEDAAAGWTSITTAQTGRFSEVVRYNNVIYFIQAVGGTGTAQSRATLGAGAWTAQPNVPKGNQAFILKDRMFVFSWSESTMYWSKATDPTVWAAPDGGSAFISPGDGDVITKVVYINNNIYIFKRNKTFVFTFNTDPATDGQITPLSTVRGAHDALVYNNEIYIVNDQSVYKLVNNWFTDIGLLTEIYTVAGLDQITDPQTRLFIEAGDRLIVGPVNITNPAQQLFTHYTMNLKTGAWSTRTYDDGACAPTSIYTKKWGQWRDSNLSTGASTGNIYVSSNNIASYTIFHSYNVSSNFTLDVNTAEHTISPEYSMITHELIPEDLFPIWKRCYYITVRGYFDWDVFHDVDPMFNIRVSPDLYTAVQTISITRASSFFVTEKEQKLTFLPFRFKSCVIEMKKASFDAGTVIVKNPDDSQEIRIQQFVFFVDTKFKQPSEAVNAT